jgi:hypothetical protein
VYAIYRSINKTNREYAIRNPTPTKPNIRADDRACINRTQATMRRAPERNNANAKVKEFTIYLVE